MPRALLFCTALAFSLTLPGALWAFDKPECTAGPIHVEIQGPAKVSERIIPVSVTIKNEGATPVAGSLRMGVIDDWRITPAEDIAIEIASGETQRREFQLEAGPKTYNAHYPVHARVEFNADGAAHTAHAVLILETELADPPQIVRPGVWMPIAVQADSELPLWRLPVHRTFLQVFNEPAPRILPPGWQGSEGVTRASVTFGATTRGGRARDAIFVHPPWFGGRAGIAITEFPLELSATPGARLVFATAIQDHAADQGEPPSDGVTFRVRVAQGDAPEAALGEVQFERHSAAKTWEEAEVDLSVWAGRSIRLQLETHPGPKNDTTCDRGLWGAPRVVCGTLPERRAFPPTDVSAARSLGDIEDLSGRRYEVRVWPGVRGLLDATYGIIPAGVDSAPGLFYDGFHVRVQGDALESASSISHLVEVREESAPEGRLRFRHRFDGVLGAFDVIMEAWKVDGALRISLALENTPAPQPWNVVRFEDVSMGQWSDKARRVYAGAGNVLQEPEAFVLGCDGHQLSTSFVGYEFGKGLAVVQGVNTPPLNLEVAPEERRYSVHAAHPQTWTLVPAVNIWDAVRTWRRLDTRPAGGSVAKVAGKFVFDLWGGGYADSATALEKAFRYGLTDAMVVWHNWQRYGYDYRLPDIFPPNPKLGSLEDFQRLAQVCKDQDVLFAPHDNYIDFYPDADQYSYEHIAFHEGGQPIRGWLNEGRGAQAYRWRNDTLRPFVEKNIRLIREAAQPTAYFIDVWSSIRPYDYWTADGQYFEAIYSRDTWSEIFSWIRDYLGDSAPQISESGHDQLIGGLDGAQANHLRVDPEATGQDSWFTWRVRCADSERIPWLDAAYHDRFVLHGAGYDPRYRAGLDAGTHGIFSDDYIATEVLTGHPAMVPAAFGRDMVRKYWLLHDVGQALAGRSIERVEFVGENLHRQCVTWDNGKVWVNRGPDAWDVGGRVLPQYGYHAQVSCGGSTVESAVELREGLWAEWSKSPDSWYVNGRRSGSDAKRCNPGGEAVDFGGVQTAGACRLAVESGSLTLTPLPEGQVFSVIVDWGRLPWKLPRPETVETVSETGEVVAVVPPHWEGDVLRLECGPDLFQYRLRQ
jgi:hypothetical protein